MLAMFRDVSFLSSNVTFKRAEDDRIAKERRSLACARENRQLWPSTMDSIASNGIPRVVVELVAEEVHSERGAFVDVCANAHDIFQKLGDADPNETLRTMSLVHPSWTGIAQRCLRRRISAWSLSELHNLFRSHHLGPWVQELAIRDCPNGFHNVWVHPSEVERMLCGILQRCPNLERLYRDIEVKKLPNEATIVTSNHRFLQELGRLLCLEGLWLRQSGSQRKISFLSRPGIIDFWDFYASICIHIETPGAQDSQPLEPRILRLC